MIDLNPFELKLLLRMIRDESKRIDHLKKTHGHIPHDLRAEQEILENIEDKFSEH